MLAACGCTNNDTEGLINLPLTAREIQAVVFFKIAPDGEVRVSMRSKYDVDVRRVANEFGGGGHKNAAGFTVTGALADVRAADHRAAGRRDRRGAGEPAVVNRQLPTCQRHASCQTGLSTLADLEAGELED